MKKILIVDDDANARLLLEYTLKRTGYELVIAKNGLEAISIVNLDCDLSLIILDIRMPGMDGIETTRLIRQLNPTIPIVAQTAFNLPGIEEKMRLAGCTEYLLKPINLEELTAIVQRLLS